MPVGVLLWGNAAESPIDTTLGRAAQGWGTYVIPEARGVGVSSKLRRAGAKVMRELGFDAVVGAADRLNERGLETGKRSGFRITQQLGVLDLGGS